MNGIRNLGRAQEDPIYIARQLYDWLDTSSQGTHRRPLQALICWQLIVSHCKPGLDAFVGLENYERVFNEWRLRQRHARHTKSFSSTRMLFRSAMQQAAKKAASWPGFRDGPVTCGVNLLCKGNSIILRAIAKEPVMPAPQAEKVLNTFYVAVSNREWEVAWRLLEPAYRQRRWQDDLGRFVHGYADMLVMQDLLLVPRTVNENSCVIDTFYEEKRQLPIIPALSDWTSLSIGEVRDRLPEMLETLTTEFRKLGADSTVLNRLPFKQLFYEDALTAIPWELQIPSSKVEEAYPDTEVKTLRLSRRAYLTLDSGEWLIRRIAWVNT